MRSPTEAGRPERTFTMFKALRTGHRLTLALLAAYLIALAFVVFSPTPVDQDSGRFLDNALVWLHRQGVPGWFSYSLVEWLSNIALFLPFGFLFAGIFVHGVWWKTTISGLALSAGIECVQLLFLEHRTASLLDIVANTLGALAGALILCFSHSRGKNTLV